MKKEFKISIIGLGYVGLPLYLLCNRKGFDVSGFDIDNKKILKLKKNISDNLDVENQDLKKLKIKNYLISKIQKKLKIQIL